MPPQPPPGGPQPPQQMISLYEQDQGHLKILSICYYVMAGLSLVSGLVFIAYIIMGGLMVAGTFSASGPSGGAPRDAEALQMMGGMFMGVGVLAMLFILLLAVLEFIVARRIVERKSRVLCMVVAGINCLSMPFGTVLGVFTFIVLSRPQVAASFDQDQASGS